jgi:hypothetical protein
MQIHGRAKLGPAGWLAPCEAIESGMTFRRAAACLNAAPATAHRWWHRYRDACAHKQHRFERPGHAVTEVRSKTSAEKRAGSGYDFAHAIVDDHSRLAYVELLEDERAHTVTAFTTRALDCYIHNGLLRELLTAHKIGQLRTEPYRPQTNGTIERSTRP